jgi:hypothetical protein
MFVNPGGAVYELAGDLLWAEGFALGSGAFSFFEDAPIAVEEAAQYVFLGLAAELGAGDVGEADFF